VVVLARGDAVRAAATEAAVDLDDIVLHQARRLRDANRMRVDTSMVTAEYGPGACFVLRLPLTPSQQVSDSW
jgi:hypothetical protein